MIELRVFCSEIVALCNWRDIEIPRAFPTLQRQVMRTREIWRGRRRHENVSADPAVDFSQFSVFCTEVFQTPAFPVAGRAHFHVKRMDACGTCDLGANVRSQVIHGAQTLGKFN